MRGEEGSKDVEQCGPASGLAASFGVKRNAGLCSFARSNKGKCIYTPSSLSAFGRTHLTACEPTNGVGSAHMARNEPFLAGGHDVVSGETEPTTGTEYGSFDVERTERTNSQVI